MCFNLSHADTERFWSKVAKAGPDECWEWQASGNPQGYGHFTLNGRQVKAHRVALSFERDVPPDLHVLHKCDNRGCCNPRHLFVGTQTDNMQDCAKKGRGGRAKIRPSMVPGIRRMLAAGYTQTSVAEILNVSRSAISLLHLGKTWNDGNPPPPKPARRHLQPQETYLC